MENDELPILVRKGELKAKMFEYLRAVEETGKPLLVTDHGTPTVIISPYHKKFSIDQIFAPFRDKFKVKGDLLESENDEWGELA
jgi:prevent-host-death family protein